jgi:hypothetical protein
MQASGPRIDLDVYHDLMIVMIVNFITRFSLDPKLLVNEYHCNLCLGTRYQPPYAISGNPLVMHILPNPLSIRMDGEGSPQLHGFLCQSIYDKRVNILLQRLGHFSNYRTQAHKELLACKVEDEDDGGDANWSMEKSNSA